MTDTNNTPLPGEHPHSDQPNWKPADNADDYFNNCKEGLEKFSHRRACKLIGINLAHSWRIRLAAELPEELLKFIFDECKRRRKKPRPERARQYRAGSPWRQQDGI